LWSSYKGQVFTCLYKLACSEKINLEFLQLAETENQRILLSKINKDIHKYPYTLMYEGSYDDINKIQLLIKSFIYVWRKNPRCIVIYGYHRIECWGMLLAALLRGNHATCFLDSTINDRKQSIWKNILKRVFMYFCKLVFCYGIRSRQYLLYLGVADSKIITRCQSSVFPENYNKKNVVANRVKYAKTLAGPRFLYVGRLSKEKNLEFLIKSFQLVVLKDKSSELIIVGDGNQKDFLANLVKNLGLIKNVRFLGSKSSKDLVSEYYGATCLVLPSISEPWGLVVNEALMYGCPVIVSSNCGCVPELVINGKTGYSFDPENSHDLVSKMILAKKKFNNVRAVALVCTKIISKYTPQNAALQIFNGLKKLQDIS